MISIIIPFYNEEDNLLPLFKKLEFLNDEYKNDFEIIAINDGSIDNTKKVLNEIAKNNQRVTAIHLRRNYGQTAAMMAGFDHASGDIIIAMDGDLQNDPSDIVKLVSKLDEGYDVVSGWRKFRKDSAIKRNFLSKVANWIISKVSGVKLNDYGCSLKAYRKHIIKEIKLYGEMHRFIPIYAKWQGAKITQIPVKHHARQHGASKYGMERTFKVVLDLFVVIFLHKYMQKPIYVFGGFGIFCFAISFLSALLAMFFKVFGYSDFVQTPLPVLSMITFLMSGMCILMGLLAEIIIRTYHESQEKSIYAIAQIKSKNIEF